MGRAGGPRPRGNVSQRPKPASSKPAAVRLQERQNDAWTGTLIGHLGKHRTEALELCLAAGRYVLDLWVHQWRRRHARGRVSIMRYADDFEMGFESAGDARRMMADLKDRLAKFSLALHEDKTRLIAFARLPALTRQQLGELRPETFAFLPSWASPIIAGGPGMAVYREAQDAEQNA